MTVEILYLDSETFSETPIKNGTHAYATDSEIMLISYALDDGTVKVVDLTAGEKLPAELVDAMADDQVTIVAHNQGFDRTVFRHNKMPVPASRWHDTMVQALAHSLPAGLDTLCAALKVPTDQAKDKAGKSLIQLFCKPRPKNMLVRRATRLTHPREWAAFKEYAKSDIVAMRECHKRMPKWNSRGFERELWLLDQRINDRGVCVDLSLCSAAVRAATREQGRLAEETQDRTDNAVQAATQRDKMLAHILEAYGVQLPDMQTSTLERRAEDPDLPLALRELLLVRLSSSKTSSSKYLKVIKGTNADGRLRGLLQFCGAARTGRWAGRLFQPQNLPRPKLKNKLVDLGIELMKADAEDLVFADVMELCSSAIRGVIVPAKGKKLVVSDLSNIEGRKLAWLSGEAWKLDAFRDYDTILGYDEEGEAIRKGPDLYNLAYAKAFQILPKDVTKDQRQIGKVMELAMGYEGGVGAFLTFAAVYRLDLTALAEAAYETIPFDILEEAQGFLDWTKRQKRSTYGLTDKVFVVCDALKRMWRFAHPRTSTWWKELQNTVKQAIKNPGETFTSRKVKVRRSGSWLRIQLPSGRCLCYPGPEVSESGTISYLGVHQYTRKWQRLTTYGGKLVENITQAAARDVMAANMPAIEDDGFEIVLTVHDEIITEAPDTDDYDENRLADHMSTVPLWAIGLPLAAAGFSGYRYRKD
ncbi:DNA polymerase I [Undibacterium sp. Di26W]|uniref:DNA polymerase I n=1 Tax=Undibacterium sp. Di26W TaxID=3413035 RepID=UPI003BF309AB